MCIAVHGHKSRETGGQASPEFAVVDATANSPPDCVRCQNVMHQIACITVRCNGVEQ